MRIGKRIVFVLCLAAILAAGCAGRRVLDIDGLVVTTTPNPSLDAVAKAIVRAGVNTNWRISPEAPGRLVGFRQLGGHHAWISISYSERQYSIRLRESTMARETAATTGPSGGAGAHAGAMQPPGGARPPDDALPTVHRTYNRWVQELDLQIRSQLTAL